MIRTGHTMHRLAWIGLLLGLVSTRPMAASTHPAPISIGNADNRIAVQAGASVPRLLELTRAGGTAWRGMAAATLIGQATVAGREVPLHWRFDPDASHRDGRSASLVYEDRAAGLRLHWDWRARASHGPIEHMIRIENRSGREVWIPLQASFRFAWKTTPTQPQQQLWIDKGAGEPPPVGTHRVAIAE